MSCFKLIIIRHALSVGNQAGRMMGQLDDDLTPKGQAQAQRLAEQLLKRSRRPTSIYSSPLQRAAQTSRILAQPWNIEVQLCDDLQEMHNGIFQGLTWLQAEQHYAQLCRELEASLDWIPVPKAESLQEGRYRAEQCVQRWLAHHSNGDYIWVVSHSGFIQHLVSVLIGSDRTWGLSIPHTSVFEFWGDRERWFTQGPNRWNSELWKIHRFNDTQHLRDQGDSDYETH